MPEVAGGLDDAEDRAAAVASLRPSRAAEADRLAGDDARDRVARVHRVGVHDPGHDLGVGVHVRRRDVALRADEDLDLGDEAAGQALELLLADSFLGSTITPPLPPPYGMPTTAHFQVIHIARALTSSRLDVLVVADAALGRAAAEVVLDAVAGEDLDRAVVHLHREVDGQLAARLAQDAAQAGVEVQALGGQVELLLRDLPGVDRRGDVLGRHGWTDLRVRRSGRPPLGCGSSPGRPHGAPLASWAIARRMADGGV